MLAHPVAASRHRPADAGLHFRVTLGKQSGQIQLKHAVRHTGDDGDGRRGALDDEGRAGEVVRLRVDRALEAQRRDLGLELRDRLVFDVTFAAASPSFAAATSATARSNSFNDVGGHRGRVLNRELVALGCDGTLVLNFRQQLEDEPAARGLELHTRE